MTATALQHFAGIESGKPCGRQFLWDWHCRAQADAVASTFDQGFLPTLAEIEGVIANFKHYKAPGEDLLTADLLQAGGTHCQVDPPSCYEMLCHRNAPALLPGGNFDSFVQGQRPSGLCGLLQVYRSGPNSG